MTTTTSSDAQVTARGGNAALILDEMKRNEEE